MFESKVLPIFEFSKISIGLGLIGDRNRASGKSFNEAKSFFHFGFTLGICVFAAW